MKVFTVRYPKNTVTDILLCLLCVFCIMLVFQIDGVRNKTEVFADSVDVTGFLEENGWTVVPESEEITETVLPDKNDDVFLRYNELQLEQGFDLLPYAGKVLTKYTYELKDIPEAENIKMLYATVLIYDEKIVGADIYCPSLDGFMQGVVKD